MKLTRRQLAFVEQLFAAEIDGRLPVQSKARKLIESLGDLVLFIERTLPGRFPVVVSGYMLSQRGHIAYCEWAAKQVEQ